MCQEHTAEIWVRRISRCIPAPAWQQRSHSMYFCVVSSSGRRTFRPDSNPWGNATHENSFRLPKENETHSAHAIWHCKTASVTVTTLNCVLAWGSLVKVGKKHASHYFSSNTAWRDLHGQKTYNLHLSGHTPGSRNHLEYPSPWPFHLAATPWDGTKHWVNKIHDHSLRNAKKNAVPFNIVKTPAAQLSIDWLMLTVRFLFVKLCKWIWLGGQDRT